MLSVGQEDRNAFDIFLRHNTAQAVWPALIIGDLFQFLWHFGLGKNRGRWH